MSQSAPRRSEEPSAPLASAPSMGPVSFFLPSLGGGGAQVVFLRLANVWAARGVPVELILAHDGGDHRHRVDPQVAVVGLGAWRTKGAVHRLARHLRERRPSVVVSALEHANTVAWAANHLAGRPSRLVCTAHQLVSPALGRRTPGGLVTGAVCSAAYRGADGVVAVSEAVADDVARTTGLQRSAIHIIHNPLDVARIRELATADTEPAPARPHFVAIGRLEPVKDFPTLVRAFARVHRARGGSLTLLGEGSRRGEIEGLVRDLGLQGAVRLPGFAPNPYPYIANADALVLSSSREGFGLVLAEAMALGVQVVTTDARGGPLEVVDYGRLGRVAPSGDAGTLSRAMLAALDEPVAPEALRAWAERFDDEAVAGRYVRYLRAVAGQQRSRRRRA